MSILERLIDDVTVNQVLIAYGVFTILTGLFNKEMIPFWSINIIVLIIIIGIIRIVKETNKELGGFYKKYEFKEIKEKK